MRIKMLIGIAGHGWALSPNEETDRFEEAAAIRMIETGAAVPVDAPKERAIRKPVEKRGKK